MPPLTIQQYIQCISVAKSKKLPTLKLFFSIESKQLFSTTMLFFKQITFFSNGFAGASPVLPRVIHQQDESAKIFKKRLCRL